MYLKKSLFIYLLQVKRGAFLQLLLTLYLLQRRKDNESKMKSIEK